MVLEWWGEPQHPTGPPIHPPTIHEPVGSQTLPYQNKKHKRAQTLMWMDFEGTNVTAKKQSQQKKHLPAHHFLKINKQGALGSDTRAKSPA